jgi:large conductance mechanosensitive channel
VLANLWEDFKKFLLRGNLLDLAVAVVVGVAFNAVVQSFANDIIMGLVGAIFRQPNFNSVVIHIGHGRVHVGNFITALLNFLIVALACFIAIKSFETMQRLRRGPHVEEEIPLTMDQQFLQEIRDLLKTQAGGPS